MSGAISRIKAGFQSLSFRYKLIAGFISVMLLVSVGTGLTFLQLGKIERFASHTVKYSQSITVTTLTAVSELHRIESLLHAFLLTGLEEHFMEYEKGIAVLRASITGLQTESSIDQFSRNTAPLAQSINYLDELEGYANRLHELRVSFEKNRPLITAAVELLNPPALEFLGKVNEMIDAVNEAPAGNNQKKLSYTLTGLRYTWTQMLSHLRIALATQSRTDLINVDAFAELHGELLSDLKAMEEQGLLKEAESGFDNMDELARIRAGYMENLLAIKEMFDAGIWRKDTHLMRTRILPLIKKMESRLDGVAKAQTRDTVDAGNQLVDQLGDIVVTNLGFLLAGILAAVFLAWAIVRNIGNQVHELASIAGKVGEGDLRVKVQLSTSDELGELGERFNEMIDNLKTLHESKDKLTQDLRNAIQTAEIASRAKSEFLSSMSHELRTPLNAILGFSQLLDMKGSKTSSDQLHEYAGEIMKAGHHLLDLINEVLDLSRIEAGHLNLKCKPIAVTQTITECITQVDVGLATRRNITLTDQTDDKTLMVMADRLRLKQVIINLLSNAVKYNREGGNVTVKVSPAEDDWLCIEITDTGKGIPEGDITRLFDPFERLTFKHGNVEGTGIGLTVTKQLVEAMDGSIGVESTVGQGSTFWVELPRAMEIGEVSVTASKSLSENHITPDRIIKVLYIEDNPANTRLVMTALNQRGGYEGLSSPTAEEGLTLAETEIPSIILMDINLPGIDGYAALKILKNVEVTCNIPIIAVSANAMDTEIRQGQEAGFDDYLTKPINVEQLYEVIDKYAARSSQTDS